MSLQNKVTYAEKINLLENLQQRERERERENKKEKGLGLVSYPLQRYENQMEKSMRGK